MILECICYRFPKKLFVGFFLGYDDVTGVSFFSNQDYLDNIAWLGRRIAELKQIQLAFGFVSDIDEDRVPLDLHDLAIN